MKPRRMPIEAVLLLYLVSYLPNVMITKLVTSLPHGSLGRPLTGLETLPASLIIGMVATYLFIWLSGWHRDANAVTLLGRQIPVPTRYTAISAIGTALILFTVPLSFTFVGVSIPFIQLLMRGDILLIAPMVDILFHRKVHWWSWTALALVALSLVITLTDRGGLKIPLLAALTVAFYTVGYFIRLAMMTKISKTGDPASIRRYFVEEKMLALPLSVAALAALSASGAGNQSGELTTGFVRIWSDPVIWAIVVIGLTNALISIFSIIILLDPRENAFCLPLERAASIVAGVGGSLLLAWFWGLKMPRAAELIGAAILIGAVVLLSVAPRFRRGTVRARAET